MRFNEIQNQTLEEALSRRDFLKGAGAAAGLSTLGYQAAKQNQKPLSDPYADTSPEPEKRSTTADKQSDIVATQPDKKPAPTAPAKPQRVIPKYSPAQLEKYLIDYVSKHLPVDQAIQFLAQSKTETANFDSLVEYDAPGHDDYEGGAKYKGRGYLHLTHKSNYEKYGRMIGQDLVNDPDLLLYPNIAAEASLAYWKDYVWPTSRRIMNKFKDRFKTVVKAVTRTVNGGYNKLEERQKNVIYYTKLLKPHGTGKTVPKKKSK